MELHFSFNNSTIEAALAIAEETAEFCDAFRIGPVLLMHYGIESIRAFRAKFPQKTLFIETRIIDHEKELVSLAASVGGDWVTVLADAHQPIIRATTTHARSAGVKVMLDLAGISSFGQRVLEATAMGIQALMFHYIPDLESTDVFADRWEMARGNTSLPIYISTAITRENVRTMTKLAPAGIIVGGAVTEADDPAEEARFFNGVIKHAH